MQMVPLIDSRLSTGTADGQMLYFNESTGLWTASVADDLKWDPDDKELTADGLVFTSLLRGLGVGTSVELGSNAVDAPSMKITHSQMTPGTDSSTLIQFRDTSNSNLFGTSIVYAAETDPTIDGTSFTLTANTLNFLRHDNSAVGVSMLTLFRTTGNALFENDVEIGADLTVNGITLQLGDGITVGDPVIAFIGVDNFSDIIYDQSEDEFLLGSLLRISGDLFATNGTFTGTGLFGALAIDATLDHTITDSSDDFVFTNLNLNKDIIYRSSVSFYQLEL